jgi:cell division protein FtsI/penicillin-binding protein 2
MNKLKLLFAVFLLLFGAVVYRLFHLQVLSPAKDSANNYLHTRKIYPERGKVYDRNRAPLVLNQNSYLLYLEPQKIKDSEFTAHKLDEILKIGESTIEAVIDKTKYWVAVKSGIEEEAKKEIEALALPGVGFEQGMKRHYPEASLSAHLAGFVGKDEEGEDIGYFGLEGYYDKDLRGLPGIIESERDLQGKPIFIGTQEKVSAENGRDLLLTIDKAVQETIKRKLIQGLETYEAKAGCVIVADPSTMQILGMVCLPDYDPGKYYEFTESDFKNPAISEVYEPGSTFKPLVVAAALQEKKIKPEDTYDEEGPVKIGEYYIRTWNNKYEGPVSITRILEKSSNVGMVYIGSRLGNDKLYRYLNDFGFGRETGIDLQGEIGGFLKSKNNWYPIDYATVSFGQGIAVTPIQMIRAFASVINGGELLKPAVVVKVASSDDEKEIRKKVEKRVISDRTSAIIRKMLVATVENGEYKWTIPTGYKIGGKTGTAEIPIAGHYDPSKTIASFIGFAPADNPKFIALVLLKEPKASPWGSETAAPLFFEIAKELLVYYNIPPEQ